MRRPPTSAAWGTAADLRTIRADAQAVARTARRCSAGAAVGRCMLHGGLRRGHRAARARQPGPHAGVARARAPEARATLARATRLETSVAALAHELRAGVWPGLRLGRRVPWPNEPGVRARAPARNVDGIGVERRVLGLRCGRGVLVERASGCRRRADGQLLLGAALSARARGRGHVERRLHPRRTQLRAQPGQRGALRAHRRSGRAHDEAGAAEHGPGSDLRAERRWLRARAADLVPGIVRRRAAPAVSALRGLLVPRGPGAVRERLRDVRGSDGHGPRSLRLHRDEWNGLRYEQRSDPACGNSRPRRWGRSARYAGA